MAEPRLRYGRVGSPEGVVLEDEDGADALQVSRDGTFGSLIDKGGAVRNVRAYGAIGDGVADDFAAIQTAINARGRVILPPGRYRITQELVMKNRTWLEGMTTADAGDPAQDTTIIYDGPWNASASVLRCSTAVPEVEPTSALDSIHVHHVTLDANSKAGYGLYAAYCTNDSTFADITGKRAVLHGIRLEKMWYARATGLYGLANLGCGVTIGRYGWGGVNGVSFRNVRGHSNGKDLTFNATTNFEWGYGVGWYPGYGSTLENVVGEKNDGCGLLVGMLAASSTNSVHEIYLEGNAIAARVAGRSPRNYGLVIKGNSNARSMEVSNVYLHGEVGNVNAQSVWLTGVEPYGGLTLRNLSYGQYLDADWSNYILKGFVYFGLTGARMSRNPVNDREVLFYRSDANLRYTTQSAVEGMINSGGARVAIFFMPTTTVTPAIKPKLRLLDRFTGEVIVEWTVTDALVSGGFYTSSFVSTSGFRVGKIVGVTPAGVDVPGYLGVAVRRARGDGNYDL